MPTPKRILERTWRERAARFFGRFASDLLEIWELDSEHVDQSSRFAILRPPPGETTRDEPSESLPIAVLLHGIGDTPYALDRFGAAVALRSAISAGRIPRCHLVAPSGERGFWIDWHDGTNRWESHLLKEVIPAAEELLGGERPPLARHLVGVSMGGIGAIQIGLRHPDLFASASSLSGPILDERQAVEQLEKSINRWLLPLSRIFGDGGDREFFEAHNPFAIARRRAPQLGIRLSLAAGKKEKPFFRDTTIAFHRLLEERGVTHRFELFEGKHRWRHWTPAIERSLAWAIEEGYSIST
ncbi:MAG: alpha/beta hydrolase-fold protein [Polyangia bacterium]